MAETWNDCLKGIVADWLEDWHLGSVLFSHHRHHGCSHRLFLEVTDPSEQAIEISRVLIEVSDLDHVLLVENDPFCQANDRASETVYPFSVEATYLVAQAENDVWEEVNDHAYGVVGTDRAKVGIGVSDSAIVVSRWDQSISA